MTDRAKASDHPERLRFRLISTFAATSTNAQQVLPVPTGVSTRPDFVALSAGFIPDYEGSDDYIAGPAPTARVTFGERDITLVGNTLTANLLDHPFLRLGPAGTLNFGRRDLQDNVMNRLPDIPMTVDLGAYAGLALTNRVNERYRFSTNLQFTHDVGSVHEGFRATLSASYWYPIADFLTGAFHVSSTYASDAYMSKFFGINGRNSQRSGLPIYDADGGIKNVRVGPFFLFHFSRSWHLSGGIFYSRLVGDAADSPVTDDRGSANQFLGRMGAVYAW